jgi:hypothetical protein
VKYSLLVAAFHFIDNVIGRVSIIIGLSVLSLMLSRIHSLIIRIFNSRVIHIMQDAAIKYTTRLTWRKPTSTSKHKNEEYEEQDTKTSYSQIHC